MEYSLVEVRLYQDTCGSQWDRQKEDPESCTLFPRQLRRTKALLCRWCHRRPCHTEETRKEKKEITVEVFGKMQQPFVTDMRVYTKQQGTLPSDWTPALMPRSCT